MWRHQALTILKHTGLQSRSLDSRRSSHCFVFLGKTLNSHSASLHLYIFRFVSELSKKPDKMPGGNQDRLKSHLGGCSSSWMGYLAWALRQHFYYLVWKYARIFVQGDNLFCEANSCELQRTGYIQRQMYKNFFCTTWQPLYLLPFIHFGQEGQNVCEQLSLHQIISVTEADCATVHNER